MFDVDDVVEQAGMEKPLAVNYVLQNTSMVRGNGIAPAVVGSSETSILSTPFTGEAAGWEKSEGLVELSKVLIVVAVLIAIY